MKEMHDVKAVSPKKLKAVEELAEKFKGVRTVLLASCKSIPGQQFHEIKKNLRGKAEIKIAKKSLVVKALDSLEKNYMHNLKKELGADIALFLSDIDPFELSSLLTENQTPARAKAGELAPGDIEIEAGQTELPPGPAISELGSIGLKVAVKEGKLEIIKGAIVVKRGHPISAQVASVLSKLNIKPMRVGFIPIAAYDAKEDTVYVNIKIDKEVAYEELKETIKKALGFAVAIAFPTKETIAYIIAKAAAEERALGYVVNERSFGREDLNTHQRKKREEH